MLSYLSVLIFLFLLALYECQNGRKNKPAFFCATAILILFVGTRYETGFDWVEYEKFYSYVSPIGDNSGIYVPPEVQMEVGFGAIFSIFKTLNLPFQLVLFIVSAFNISVMAWFANRYSPRPIFVLVWYFGFALLPAQMAAIRQGISFTIVLIAIVLWQKRQVFNSIVAVFVACSIHVFSVAIAPLVLFKDWQPKTIYVLCVAAIGVFMSISQVDILDLIATNVLNIFGAGNLLADKLSIYNGGSGTSVSLMGLSLGLWDLLFLYLVERRRPTIHDEQGAVLVSFAVKCALFSVFAHSFLATFPAVWNRISYISMLVEIIVLTRWYEDVIVDAVKRQVMIIGLSGISGAMLAYGLMAPAALPYLPYQSVIYVWATGDRGDGRLRYTYAMNRAEREIQLAKH